MNRGILLIFALAFLQFSSAHAIVTEAEAIVVKGSVTRTAATGDEPAPVLRGDRVKVGSTILTGHKSDLLMVPFPASAIRVLENNSVVLTQADLEKNGETILGRKAVLELHKGTVQVGLDKVSGGSTDFRISTPQCVAAARGTVFACKTGDDSTRTIVADGIVPVTWIDAAGTTHSVEIKPGMRYTVHHTPDGLVATGPEPASKSELAELMDFVQQAANEGLLLPMIGQLFSLPLGPTDPPATIEARVRPEPTPKGQSKTTAQSLLPPLPQVLPITQ